MCFNANVSFGASAVIGAIGVATLIKAKAPSQYAFAGIPLLFAIQQFVEGVLWLALKQPDSLITQQIATFVFILIAQVIWPAWVPLSIILLEKEKSRKKTLLIFLVIGGILSAFGAYRILFYDVVAQIENHHIRYDFNIGSPIMPFAALFYILPTIISPFISSVKKMILLGTLLVSSLIISKLFFELYTISVWCFFAAIISSLVFVIISKLNFAPEIKSTSS
ncbi:MAG: DUF6629 family protein [Bacteroidota bacterium]